MSLPKAGGRKGPKMVGGFPVISSGSKNKFRDQKFTKVVYMTYVLNFPDGDQWNRQEEFSLHDLDHRLKQMIAEHFRTNSEWKLRAQALWKAGECWWKDEMGVEHLILIEEKKRKEKWGVDKADFATFKNETPTGDIIV